MPYNPYPPAKKPKPPIKTSGTPKRMPYDIEDAYIHEDGLGITSLFGIIPSDVSGISYDIKPVEISRVRGVKTDEQVRRELEVVAKKMEGERLVYGPMSRRHKRPCH